MSTESAITFFFAVLIFSITPGPGVFALLASGMSRGAKQSISLALGMTISDVVYLILACYGLASIAHHYATLFDLIQFLGALYLFYLAYKIFTSPINLHIHNEKVKKKDFIMGFIQGFLISASNPKVILFYIAFLPTFLDVSILSMHDVILVSVLTIVALMIGLMSIAIMANKAKLMLKSQTAMKRLNQTAASIMFGAGAFLLLKE
ncbi:MAG: LysE family translocator [Campylobacterota bacterium]|nr:LysE family translocator [Campylobacterota bacterium]